MRSLILLVLLAPLFLASCTPVPQELGAINLYPQTGSTRWHDDACVEC